MANITENPIYEAAIYLLATTDFALGGVNGTANVQAQQLANRTAFLKQKLDEAGVADAVEFTGDMHTLKKPGFYTILAASTNKPTSGNGFCYVAGKAASAAASGNSFYVQIFVSSAGTLFLRTYQDGAPLSAWREYVDTTPLNVYFDSIVGKIDMFGHSGSIFGYLLCDGAAVSRTIYQKLFQAIGTSFGSGNGTTTFNVPDLRGEFIRGLDLGRGKDPGRVIGSVQGEQLTDHVHKMERTTAAAGSDVNVMAGNIATPPVPLDFTEGVQAGGFGLGNQTIIENIALAYYIKY